MIFLSGQVIPEWMCHAFSLTGYIMMSGCIMISIYDLFTYRFALLFTQIGSSEHRLQEIQGDLALSGDRNKQTLHELSMKDEELVVLRVELSNLQERFKAKQDEVSLQCMVKLDQKLVKDSVKTQQINSVEKEIQVKTRGDQ